MKPTLPLLLAAVMLAGCSPDRRVSEIQDTRVVKDPDVRLGATSAQRFGGRMTAAQTSEPAGPPFVYELPKGWKELPLQQFRDVNLAAPGDVACWVTLMAAGAGGPLGNLSRWRAQFGLPPPTPADLEALPRTQLLGQPAYRADLVAPDGSSRMVGTMLFAPDRSVFVRMQGAPDAVEAQMDALRAFEASLADRGPEDSGGGSGAATTSGSGETATEAGGFGWTVPSGWVGIGASPPFKTYEFQVGDANCWLSALDGAAGGLQGNVDRWCGQIGLEPLSAAEVQALPRLEVLGQPAPYVSLLQDGTADGLLGVVVPLEGRTLFVKLAGPSDTLRERRAEFESFCASLTVKG